MAVSATSPPRSSAWRRVGRDPERYFERRGEIAERLWELAHRLEQERRAS
ncbi:MAG TPA: hypothetical protein VJ770_01140 [Stellaceae bacterium]|nr:hypothetical protein [Stellaceae bacterium]